MTVRGLTARRLAPEPPWSDRMAEEMADAIRVAHLFLERRYPTQSVRPWLILALARRLATLESSNQALRHFREVE